jgi:hypothetical protein
MSQTDFSTSAVVSNLNTFKMKYSVAIRHHIRLIHRLINLPMELIDIIESFIGSDASLHINRYKYMARHMLVSMYPELYFTKTVLSSDKYRTISPTTVRHIVRTYNGTRFSLISLKNVETNIKADDTFSDSGQTFSVSEEFDQIESKYGQIINYTNKTKSKKMLRTEYKISRNPKSVRYFSSKQMEKNKRKNSAKNKAISIRKNRFDRLENTEGVGDDINFVGELELEDDYYYDDYYDNYSDYSGYYSDYYDDYYDDYYWW